MTGTEGKDASKRRSGVGEDERQPQMAFIFGKVNNVKKNILVKHI